MRWFGTLDGALKFVHGDALRGAVYLTGGRRNDPAYPNNRWFAIVYMPFPRHHHYAWCPTMAYAMRTVEALVRDVDRGLA